MTLISGLELPSLCLTGHQCQDALSQSTVSLTAIFGKVYLQYSNQGQQHESWPPALCLWILYPT